MVKTTASLGIAIFVFIFVYSYVQVIEFKPIEGKQSNTNFNNTYNGVIHVHSGRSDGSGSVSDIAKHAQQAGVDFVVITDHEAGAEARLEAGYYGNVLVLIAAEISTPEGHFLYIPHPDSSFFEPKFVSEHLYDLKNNAIIIGAHPVLQKNRLTEKAAKSIQGIETVNADYQWRTTSKLSLLQALVLYPFVDYSMNLIPRYPNESMRIWKEQQAENGENYVMVGSADAHARIEVTDSYFWEFPSYYKVFRMIQTKVMTEKPLSGDYLTDARLVYNAIKKGNSFVAFEGFGSTAGFFFTANGPDAEYGIGDQPELEHVTKFNIHVPLEDNIRVYIKTPEKVVLVDEKPEVEFMVQERGKYYVEVFQLRKSLTEKDLVEIPWIITNAIHVR